MKNYIITMDESVFYGPMLSRVIEACPDKIDGVFIVPRPMSPFSEVVYYSRFWGLKAFFYISFLSVWRKISKKGSVESYAKKHNISCRSFKSKKELFKHLSQLEIDVIIACVPFFVPEKALKFASKYWLNTHCGPLPRYAGLDAPFWSMLNDEKQLAVTIHEMTPVYDKGQILSQKFINNEGSYFKMLFTLFSLAGDEHIRLLKSDYTQVQEIKSLGERSYFSRPSLLDAKKFRKKGYRFL